MNRFKCVLFYYLGDICCKLSIFFITAGEKLWDWYQSLMEKSIELDKGEKVWKIPNDCKPRKLSQIDTQFLLEKINNPSEPNEAFKEAAKKYWNKTTITPVPQEIIDGMKEVYGKSKKQD